MNFWPSFDALGAAIVLGGTAVATLARCGVTACKTTAVQLRELARPRFDLASHRAQLASQVSRMQRDGVIRSEPALLDDPELSDANRALCQFRSVDAMLHEHERHRALREHGRAQTILVLERASELAPVMGLAGTLIALAQLPSAGLAGEADIIGAVSIAVVSTLAGLLLANLVLTPLAEAVRRRGEHDELQREELVQWLAKQLAPACPTRQIPTGAAA